VEVWDEVKMSKDDLIGRVEMKDMNGFVNNKGELEIEMCDENEEGWKAKGRIRMEITYEVNEREAMKILGTKEMSIISDVKEKEKKKKLNIGTLKVNILSFDV
jgi:hypothetical protein